MAIYRVGAAAASRTSVALRWLCLLALLAVTGCGPRETALIDARRVMATELPLRVHLGHGAHATEVDLPKGAVGATESLNLRLHRREGFGVLDSLTIGPAVLELDVAGAPLRAPVAFRQRVRSEAPHPVTVVWDDAVRVAGSARRFLERSADLPRGSAGEIWEGHATRVGFFALAGSPVPPTPLAGEGGLDDGPLEVSPVRFDFGQAPPGSDSPVRFFRITHRASELTGVLRTALSAQPENAFGIASSTCFGALGEGQSCFIGVVFQPRVPGAATAQLEVTDDRWRARAALEGRGVRPAQLHALRDRLAFDVTAPGRTRTMTLQITNVGDIPLPRFTLAISGPGARVFLPGDPACSDLPPNGLCEFPVTFAPAHSGVFLAVLEAGAMAAAPARVIMEGHAATAPALTSLPGQWNFGRVLIAERSPPKRVVITNEGEQDARAVAVRLEGADAEAFSLLEDGCTGRTLGGSESCELAIDFGPRRLGAHEVQISLALEGARETHVALRGQGVGPVILVADPDVLDFGAQAVCPTNRTLVLRNPGGFPTGPVHLDAAAVRLCPPTQERPPFCLVANRCTEALAPDGACSITFSFCPGARGAYETLVMLTATPGGELPVVLRGQSP